MTLEQFELLYNLLDQQKTSRERCGAALSIAKEVRGRKIEMADVPRFYQALVEFWKSLGESKTDRDNKDFFEIRKILAGACQMLSLRQPGEPKIFTYYPKVKKAEGYDDRFRNKLVVGALRPGYGTSIYEFHHEYPIEGIGIQKDLISVITEDDQRIPMLDWCRQNDIIVFCNRCGLEITYEVSMDCPFMKWRFTKP
jgi:hypothetical protein